MRTARIVGVLGLLGVGLALTGCASSGSASRPGASAVIGASARIGSLQITGAYVPAPASPDVAAAYFSVTNRGSTSDTLTSVLSDVSTQTGLHTYAGSTMVPLRSLAIPAGKIARLLVGGTHLMIESPTRALAAGQTVRLTLTFASAGAVVVMAPVVAATGPQDEMSMTAVTTLPPIQ